MSQLYPLRLLKVAQYLARLFALIHSSLIIYSRQAVLYNIACCLFHRCRPLHHLPKTAGKASKPKKKRKYKN